jgi:hypothetical protein
LNSGDSTSDGGAKKRTWIAGENATHEPGIFGAGGCVGVGGDSAAMVA